MARTKSMHNSDLLEAALEGLEIQRKRIDEQIQEVRGLLGRTSVRRGRPAATNSSAPVKRVLSAAARKRIAAAQKRRWAQFRKSSAEA